MKRLLITTVATIILLWSTTLITAQASSILRIRSFRTNLVKGEYVDEHTDVSTPTDIEPVIDGDTVGMEEPIETDATEPDETMEEYLGEIEEEIDETEVQSTQ